jgi:phage gp37-like protein
MSMIFPLNFTKNSRKMAHNVPAVYDVWAGIKGLCEAKTARPNVPE